MKNTNSSRPPWGFVRTNQNNEPIRKMISLRLVINLLGLLTTWGVWFWMAGLSLPGHWFFWIGVVGVLLLIPLIFLGRWVLDQQPFIRQAILVIALMHYVIAIFLGSALIAVFRFAQAVPEWSLPLPGWVGILLMVLSGVFLFSGLMHLLNRGLGLPLGTELTRNVVTNWVYAWTRNPVVLSSLAFLLGIGLWLGSGTFLLWVLALVFPALLVFLSVFEERELEIRFGEDYLNYKLRTPMLWPRKPKKNHR